MLQRLVEKPERALCGLDVARLADEEAQALQRERGHPVARRGRAIVAGLGAMDELLVVVAREVEAAALTVFELLEQEVRQRLCPLQVFDSKIGLHELEQRVE